jgi:hypothetical protein
MSARSFGLAAALALAALTPAAWPAGRASADAVAPGTVEGTIASIDTGRSVIVITVGARERRARFGPLTVVRLGGLPGAVTDLRPGMRVVVRFAPSASGGEAAMLLSIDAWR